MSPRARVLAGVGSAALFLAVHVALGGWRADPGWFALGGLVAWTVWCTWEPGRPLAAFVAPLLIVGAVYDAQRYWAEALRGPVHVVQPYAFECAWFGVRSAGGVVTLAHWCQTHTHPLLDAITGAVYLAYLPGFIALAAWWRFAERRTEAQQMMWALLWLNLAGYVIYLVYPAAPPWYVDHYGLGPAILTAPPEAAGAARFDALFHVHWFAAFYGKNTNIFGAIPSIHVGQTLLAVLYAWRLRSLRALTTVFFALLLFASVYLNHHYIVDGLVGMALAAAVFAALTLVKRSPARSPDCRS